MSGGHTHLQAQHAAGTAGSKSCFLKTVDVFEAVNGLKCMAGGNGSFGSVVFAIQVSFLSKNIMVTMKFK